MASEPPMSPNPMIPTVESLSEKAVLHAHHPTVTGFLMGAMRRPSTLCNGFDLPDHLGKFFGLEGLLAIRDRMRRIGMHLDNETVGARGDGGARDGGDVIGMTR
jgi:hypothetical protein